MNYALLVSGVSAITYVKHVAGHTIFEVSTSPRASFFRRWIERLFKRKQSR